mmetsp:Transcript_22084/g.29119  ORF Transcript_22084/g.29119 Transcript_22084/m.29119 type:complete len:346 (+) Transcript_22084:57-1094(+)
MMSNSKRLRTTALIAAIATIGLTLNVRQSANHFQRRTSADLVPEAVAKHIGDVTSPVNDADTAVFWHIPKDSGSSVKSYYLCMGLVVASNESEEEGHGSDTTLQVWELDHHRLVNVDTTLEKGLERAKNLGLAESGLADVVFTMFPRHAAEIFSEEHPGRLFAFFRHPVDRAVSQFYYRSIASWEKSPGIYRPDFSDLGGMEEWLLDGRSPDQVNNYMVRLLVNKHMGGPVTEDDLEMAKEILRTKVLVGLVSKMEESVDRYDQYFGFYDNDNRDRCYNVYISKGFNKNNHKSLEEGSKAWNMLAEMDLYDMKLYEYAIQLFDEQERLFEKEEENVADQTVLSEK